jgi:CheY-like chemotaxis protein
MTSGSVRPVVLIVEDDPDTRDMYALYLEYRGMRVLTATSADEAFALALEHLPDVVITDFVLAGGVTGADLCRLLHNDERTAHIPALLVTGSTRKADAEAALGAGCADIRIKPYLPDDMVTDVLQLLPRSRGERMVG